MTAAPSATQPNTECVNKVMVSLRVAQSQVCNPPWQASPTLVSSTAM
jgi:hypothetical protein